MGILGDLLLSKTRAAEDRETNINTMMAQGLISAMGKQNPDGSPVMDARTLSDANDQLMKLRGTTKEGKGLVQQFGGLVQKLHGHAHQQAGTQPGAGGQGNPQRAGADAPPPGSAGATGATGPGGTGSAAPAGSSTPLLPPPPTPATSTSSAATAPDAAAAMSTPMMPPPPPPGASVGAGNASPTPSPAGAPASPPLPASFAQIMSRAGTPRQPTQDEQTAILVARQTALKDAEFKQKDAQFQSRWIMPGTPEYNEGVFGISPKTAAEIAAGGNIFSKMKSDYNAAFGHDPSDAEVDAYFKMNPPVDKTVNVAPGHEIIDQKTGQKIAGLPPLPRAPARTAAAKDPAAKAAADAQKAALAAQKEYESELDKYNRWHTDHYIVGQVQTNPYTQSLAEKKDKLAKARRVAAAGASGLTPPPASAAPSTPSQGARPPGW